MLNCRSVGDWISWVARINSILYRPVTFHCSHVTWTMKNVEDEEEGEGEGEEKELLAVRTMEAGGELRELLFVVLCCALFLFFFFGQWKMQKMKEKEKKKEKGKSCGWRWQWWRSVVSWESCSLLCFIYALLLLASCQQSRNVALQKACSNSFCKNKFWTHLILMHENCVMFYNQTRWNQLNKNVIANA